MPVNTAYLGSGQTTLFTSNVSLLSQGTLVVADMRSTSLISASNVSINGVGDFLSGRTQAGLRSFLTTASATSAILPDGMMGVYFHSGNSCRLCFRSGATTYTIIATTGGVL